MTASLRPPFLLFFIPFLIQQKYNFLLGSAVGLLFGLLSSLTVTNIFVWQSYISAMLGMTGLIDLNKYLPSAAQPSIDSIIYPKVIEGITVNTDSPLEFNILEDSSMYRILNSLNIPHVIEILIIGAVVSIILLSLFIIKYNFDKNKINFTFLFGILTYLIGEFFVPIPRYSYYDIQWILPLLIIVNQVDSVQLLSNKLLAVLLLGLLLAMGCFSWIPKFLLFSSFLIAFYVTLTSLILIQQEAKK